MENLIECRNKLDKIDNEILRLFEERMEVIKTICEYKIKNNLPTYDASREKEMIEKNSAKVKNKELVEYYKELLKEYLLISKKFQDSLKEKQN